MQLPYNLVTNTYTAPRVFLCETDKTKICELNTIGLNGTFKFNSYSEIEFQLPRMLLDSATGEAYVHPFYDKLEALRLLYLPGFGYFEIQDPSITSNGMKEIKQVNAFSLEYTLSQKYIVNFIINSPEEEGNIGGGTPSSEDVDPLVVFYDVDDQSHSLLHLALQKALGWDIGYVHPSLTTQTRSFNVDRESIYDFLMNDVAETFKCYFVFDTERNLINVYPESSSVKFMGDGSTTQFIVRPAYSNLGDVTVDGYRTTEYLYDTYTGEIKFTSKEPPKAGAIIEVNDGSQSEWQTNVFVSFDNLASSMEIDYEADNIKTCLTVTGADDLDISDVNLGSNYIMDLSYYHTVDWMGQDLYDAYNAYIKKVNEKTPEFTSLLQQYNDVYQEYSELYNRVTTTTEPEFVINLTELKLDHFHQMLRRYYEDRSIDGNFPNTSINIVDQITEDFKFLGTDVIDQYLRTLQSATNIFAVEVATATILDKIWDEFGVSLLKTFVEAYKLNQQTHISSGWSADGNSNYYMYWANYMMLVTCNSDLTQRTREADDKTSRMNGLNKDMAVITDMVALENNFTQQQLVRLNAFIREDEYSDSNFVVTDIDTTEDVFKTKKELMQCGKIELAKLCEPKLAFSAKLANIYALEDFAPIVHQFQLGNIINVSLRPGYVKKVRLMEVEIDFEDFSDFSCVFGDLMSAKSQIDIHADLLQAAASAGKSVAANEAKWQRANDLATATDLKIQNGLIDAVTSIRSSSPEQAMEWDNYGLHLRKYVDGSSTEYNPKQALFTNNQLLFTKDNWKTVSTGIGEFTYNGKEFFGICAEAVLSGYIEGSEIVGGVIKIGDRGDGTYNFEIDQDGIVTFRGEKGTAGELSTIGLQMGSLRAAINDLSQQQQIYSDYVIEYGDTGIWHYEKWNSGKAVCYGRKELTEIKFTGSVGETGMYSCPAGDTTIEYPTNLFVETPSEQVTGRCTTTMSWLCNNPDGNGLNDKTHTAAYSFIAPVTTEDVQTAYIDYYVVGNWKE